MKCETLKVSRIGEDIYALLENNEIVELRIADYTKISRAKLGQAYAAKVKTVETRLSAAFVDLGGEVAFLPFDGKRPEFLVEGKLILVKIVRAEQEGKKAVVKHIGEVNKNQIAPELVRDLVDWGAWPAPRDADGFETQQIMDIIEDQISNTVLLKNGGDISIESTRAAIAIDVDASGRTSGGTNQRNFNHKLNLEAAREAMRQIRLRNLSGLIIIDFVGAPSKIEALELLAVIKENLPNGRKCEILPISKFGICEIARENYGAPLYQLIGKSGTKTTQRIAIDAVNALATRLSHFKGDLVKLKINPNAHAYLQTWEYDWKTHLAQKIGGRYEIQIDETVEFVVYT